MPDHASANFAPLVSREQAGNAIGDALRLFVGRGRRYSVKQLSNASGIKDRVIECAMCAPDSVDYRPLPVDALLSISRFIGPAFTSEWLRLAEQEARYLDVGDHDDVAARAIDFAAEYARSRHHESECGVDIGPGEDKTLGAKRVELRAVA